VAVYQNRWPSAASYEWQVKRLARNARCFAAMNMGPDHLRFNVEWATDWQGAWGTVAGTVPDRRGRLAYPEQTTTQPAGC
jgi:hypothetical protein